jgi:SAM-dependent methyltransferase
MRKFTPGKYRRLLELTNDQILRAHMAAELEIINSIEHPQEKTFIDLGAGYGRLTGHLAGIAKKVISVEINPAMLRQLRKVSQGVQNASVIKGDFTRLSSILLPEGIEKLVFLLMQNTLGTLEGANAEGVFLELNRIAKPTNGEIVISLFRQEALHDWGMQFYQGIQEMSGAPDLEKTDFLSGLFVSETGYTSKWRSKAEIESMIKTLEARVLHEIWSDQYCVLHLVVM